MKILPISLNSNYVQNNTFKGLWGQSEHNISNESKKTTYIYYPFTDETKSQIEKVVKDICSRKELSASKNIQTCVQEFKVAVMDALPFSSKEFMNYTLNRLPITKQRLIEKHIIGKNLSILKK